MLNNVIYTELICIDPKGYNYKKNYINLAKLVKGSPYKIAHFNKGETNEISFFLGNEFAMCQFFKNMSDFVTIEEYRDRKLNELGI